MLARIKQLPPQAAVDELFFQDELGFTALAVATVHFSGLISLCGIEALAVRSTDDLPLLVLRQCDSWEAASARIETSPAQAAIEEKPEKDEEGRTTLASAVVADAPVELLESMVELGKQDTKNRNIVFVCDKGKCDSLQLAAVVRTDTVTIKLLVREYPGALYAAINLALKYNKNSTAVVSLLRKCLAAWEHGTATSSPSLTSVACPALSALATLAAKEYVELYPVHHVATVASDITVIKSMIREHEADDLGSTVLDLANLNFDPAFLPFFAEAETAFRNGNYPALIKLCAPTPDWNIRARRCWGCRAMRSGRRGWRRLSCSTSCASN